MAGIVEPVRFAGSRQTFYAFAPFSFIAEPH